MVHIKVSAKQLEKCAKCERPARARVNGVPYCVIHYRSERTKLKDSVLKQIITNAQEMREAHPELAEVIDKIIVPGADSLFRETRNVTSTRPKTIQELEKELMDTKRELAKLSHLLRPTKKK